MKRQSLALTLLVIPLSLAASPKREAGFASIKGTAAQSAIMGTARFEDVDDGLRITLDLKGLPDGEHAVHIHDFGDCSEEGKAAGNHYNPDSAPHGHAVKDGKKAHPGDMGNLVVRDGAVAAEIVLPRAALNSGKRNVAGRSIIVHEKQDDFSQPAGNAGGRIACGVIVIVGK